MSRPLNSDFVERTSKVLRKVVVTLICSGVVYLTTSIVDGPAVWTITLSVFIGGVALVVQYLVEFENRFGAVEASQAQHFTTIEKLINEKFSSINEATELFGLVESSMLRTDLVTQLVRNSTRLTPASHQLIYDFAQSEIGRISDFIRDLGEGGDITYDGEDRDWMLGLTRNAKFTIDATSLTAVDAGSKGFDDGGLWWSDLGQRYLEAQRAAVQRGVTVRRVFVLDRPDRVGDPDLARICKLHQEMGILIRVLDPSTLPGTRKTSMFDFILFDDVLSYESTLAAWTDEGMRPVIVKTSLVRQHERVKERVQRFRDLWESARELS